MTERPITFKPPMVRAILEGRKTQTRRVLKPQPELVHDPYDAPKINNPFNTHVIFRDRSCRRQDVPLPAAPGDLLWVKEAFRLEARFNNQPPSAADPVEDWVWYEAGPAPTIEPNNARKGRLRSPIHMLRWASRLTLRVTDVRVERVQEISHPDTIAEGVECETCRAMRDSACARQGCPASRIAFRDLWDSINAKRGFGWDANPWVAAISFTVEEPAP